MLAALSARVKVEFIVVDRRRPPSACQLLPSVQMAPPVAQYISCRWRAGACACAPLPPPAPSPSYGFSASETVVATAVVATAAVVAITSDAFYWASRRGDRSRPWPLRCVLAWLVLAVPAVGAQTATLQVQTLEALYNAMNGAGWSGNVGNTNWLSGDPCTPAGTGYLPYNGHWAGVTCSGDDVTGL